MGGFHRAWGPHPSWAGFPPDIQPTPNPGDTRQTPNARHYTGHWSGHDKNSHVSKGEGRWRHRSGVKENKETSQRSPELWLDPHCAHDKDVEVRQAGRDLRKCTLKYPASPGPTAHCQLVLGGPCGRRGTEGTHMCHEAGQDTGAHCSFNFAASLNFLNKKWEKPQKQRAPRGPRNELCFHDFNFLSCFW